MGGVSFSNHIWLEWSPAAERDGKLLHPCQVAVAFDVDTLPCSLSQLVIDGALLFRITGCVFVSLLATFFSFLGSFYIQLDMLTIHNLLLFHRNRKCSSMPVFGTSLFLSRMLWWKTCQNFIFWQMLACQQSAASWEELQKSLMLPSLALSCPNLLCTSLWNKWYKIALLLNFWEI